MSFADALFQTPMTVLPFTQLLTGMVQLILLGGLLMFFRPLLVGIARALVLVRPRPTKDERARRKLRDDRILQAAAARRDPVDRFALLQFAPFFSPSAWVCSNPHSRCHDDFWSIRLTNGFCGLLI
jgi:hypothetical protein